MLPSALPQSCQYLRAGIKTIAVRKSLWRAGIGFSPVNIVCMRWAWAHLLKVFWISCGITSQKVRVGQLTRKIHLSVLQVWLSQKEGFFGFFWFEPSKPLANWLESWVSTGWNSLCLCFINEKSSPRQKGSVDDDHFVMPVQQNEKISNQDPAQAEGTKPLLLLYCLKEYCFILFIYLRLSLEDWNHLKLNNEHWRN